MSAFLRTLIAVLLMLALPLQAAELARRAACPPVAAAALHHDMAMADHEGGHGGHHADAGEPAAQAPSHASSHAHADSGCCKTCMAGCCSWVFAEAAAWSVPEQAPAAYPPLAAMSKPEPFPGGLERPPRTARD